VKLLVDMNLSPLVAEGLNAARHDPEHWSAVGSPSASDDVILSWAAAHDRILMTHDLDFGAILAVCGASRPSVVQVRSDDLRPDTLVPQLLTVLRRFARELRRGALVSMGPMGCRARVLPFQVGD